MSWDLYCYKPSTESPDADEAQAIIEADEADAQTAWPNELRKQVVQALLASNSRLEAFPTPAALDNPEPATGESIGTIELNPPEGDLVIQISVSENQVFFAIPYWYQGADAERTFAQLLSYARLLREQFGFFAYDPQTGEAFDPAHRDSLDHAFYEKTVRSIPSMAASSAKPQSQKPWWKFW